MLATVVVFFFACMLPFKVLTLWIVTLQVEVMDVVTIETFYIMLYFSRVMFYINSAINPILYNIMSSKFREGFKRVFHCVDWPLSPRRRHLGMVGARSSSSDWRMHRRTTYTSSTFTSQSRSCCRMEMTAAADGRRLPSTRISKASFEPSLGLERCQENNFPPPAAEGIEENFSRASEDQPRSSRSPHNAADGGPSSRHHDDVGIGSKNIVFIEERKILLIPTSTAAAAGGSASSTSGSSAFR
jgi:hypothetical protein